MKNKKRSRGGGGAGVATTWGGEDHEYRKQRKLEQKRQDGSSSKSLHRQAVLTHETAEKRSQMQLKLHVTKVKREIDVLKAKLKCWDPEEAAMLDEQEAAKKLIPDEDVQNKKKGRKGPESWKLRGPARPACEVYDFDTRYVDPHIQAQEKAKAKAKRTVNLLSLYKGRMAQAIRNFESIQPDGSGLLTARAVSMLRQYLSALMQLGHLSLESKQYKSAREAWLECIELEGTGSEEPLTTATEMLLRMYLDLQRWETAWQFVSEQMANASSVWIAFSRVLLAFKLDKPEPDQHLIAAVRSNIYCAYYLAFFDTFRTVMEYTDDLTESDDEPQTDLEEAIDYCNACAADWQSVDAARSMKTLLVQALSGRHGTLTTSDVEWKQRIANLQQKLDHVARDDDDDENSTSPDIKMYAGMYQTAMEMLRESGQLSLS